jgi:hypothetical protein
MHAGMISSRGANHVGHRDNPYATAYPHEAYPYLWSDHDEVVRSVKTLP